MAFYYASLHFTWASCRVTLRNEPFSFLRSWFGKPISIFTSLHLLVSAIISPFPLSSFLIPVFGVLSFLSLCHDLITKFTGGRLNSPPPVLLLSFFCPPPSPLFFGSYSLPLGHLSLSRGLSDLSGGHHGNLHPGHPLLEPLGDPVRLLEVTWGQRVVESYLSSSDLSLSVHPSLWTFNRFATSHTQLQTSAFNSLLAEFRYNCDLLGGNDACSLLSMRKRSFLPYVMVLKKLNWIELNQINTRNSHSIILKHLTFTFSWVLVVVLFKWIKAKKMEFEVKEKQLTGICDFVPLWVLLCDDIISVHHVLWYCCIRLSVIPTSLC